MTKNRRAGGNSTYLKATIGRRTMDCLLDTGSETTVIPASMVNLQHVRETTHVLTAANGTAIPLLGEVTLRMQVGEFVTSIVGLVTEHVSEVMIGIDWMAANHVIWELGQSRIRIGKHCFQLKSKPNKGVVRRVNLQEDVIVPGRSEMDLPTKVVYSSLTENVEGVQWCTDSRILQKGVYISRTVIPQDKLRDVPVRAINVNSDPVHLYAQRNISDLQPVMVCETVRKSEEETLCTRATTEGDVEEVPEFVKKLVESVHPSLKESTLEDLKKLLMRYQDVFSQSELDLGLTTIVKHRIDTGSTLPFRQQLRRFPPAHMEAISEHVDNMLQQEVIEPACSPYASNLVLVRKKITHTDAAWTTASST
jgi:hypothetical protein